VLSPDVLEALVRLRRADRSARFGVVSAAELHLGRPLTVPVAVATRRSQGALPAALLRGEPPMASQRTDLSVEGLRLPDLERTVACLVRGAEAAHLELVTALLRNGSALERRPVEPARLRRAAAHFDDPAVRARVGWWCFRLDGEAPATPPPGSVPLWSGGSLRAPRITHFGLIVNTSDDLPDPDGRAAAELLRALRARRNLVDVAVLFTAGVALSPAWLPGPSARALERLREYRFVAREGGSLRPRPPFDGVCALLARRADGATRARLLRALAARLREPANADELAQFALVSIGLGRWEAAIARVATSRHALSDAAPSALGRLLDATPRGGLRALARTAPAVFERLGRWDDLAALLALEAPRAVGVARGHLLVAQASVAWRRDRIAEAEAALAALARVRRVAPGDRFEGALLRATLDAEAGAFAPALQALRAALSGARRDGDALAEARALHRIGSIEARKGRPRDALAHYDAALRCCPSAARALRGVLLSNSAAMQLWTGRLDASLELARAAWSQRAEVGSPAERVATRVLLARIEGARGLPLPPGGAMLPLAWEAERSGSLRLAAEVWLDAAGELAAVGRHADAREAVDRARRMLVQIPDAEPVLAGLLDEADGARRHAAGDPGGALAPLQRAVRLLERRGVAFYATRARRTLASVRLALGDPRGAMLALAKVARACEAGDLVLGDNATHGALLALAAIGTERAVRRYAERSLAELDPEGARSLVQRLDPAVARRFTARQPTPFGGPTDRPGSPAARSSATTLQAGTAGAIVVDLRLSSLLVPGRSPVSMLRRRVLVPLLAALAEAPDAGVAVETLIARVWQRRPAASARVAVKVAVSRLRLLLGGYAPALEAARVDGAPGYRWNRSRAALVVVSEAAVH
jgi:tetratricopeptide (TPR) repeat protein